MPSLKPIRLRGVACSRLVDDVRPNPSCDQRIVAEPRAMRARLRTAWNATWGSSAQACTHRSPPLRAASSSSPRSAGSSLQRRRALRRQPEPLVEQRRPEAEGDREAGGLEAERLAGVVGRRERLGVRRAGRLAGGHPRGGRRPVAQQRAQVGVGRDVEGGEVEAVLRGRGDARPGGRRRTGSWGRRRSRASRRRRRPRRGRPRPRRAGRGASGARPPPARAVGRRVARGRGSGLRARSQPASARAGARESGSASASTACESARTCARLSAS